MRIRIITVVFGGMVLGFGIPVNAESLWARRNPHHAFLIYDTQARYVGDLLTIEINENTDVQNREDRALSKEAAAEKMWQLESMTGGDLGSRSAQAEFDLPALSANPWANALVRFVPS